jgi:hypothetical protein
MEEWRYSIYAINCISIADTEKISEMNGSYFVFCLKK